jgi:hypothetical protein
MARGCHCKCKCSESYSAQSAQSAPPALCSEPSCRAARKAASQARWLAQPENHDYFRGPGLVA